MMMGQVIKYVSLVIIHVLNVQVLLLINAHNVRLPLKEVLLMLVNNAYVIKVSMILEYPFVLYAIILV